MSDTRKSPLDLVPLRALVGAARVLAHGNTKLKRDGTPHPKPRAPGDFLDRPLDGVFFASAMRHTMELQALGGVVTKESLATLDADTNLPAIDHLICNLLIMRCMLIRDGLLPIDPGPGNQPAPKPDQAAFEFFRAAETYEVGPNVPGFRDPSCPSHECAIRDKCTGHLNCPKRSTP